MMAEATTKPAAAMSGLGNARAAAKAMTPHHMHTRAEARNLSPALLTSEFHSACNSAAPRTAARTCAFMPLLFGSEVTKPSLAVTGNSARGPAVPARPVLG